MIPDREIIQAVESVGDCPMIAIVGSQAHGLSHSKSDIDCVVLNSKTNTHGSSWMTFIDETPLDITFLDLDSLIDEIDNTQAIQWDSGRFQSVFVPVNGLPHSRQIGQLFNARFLRGDAPEGLLTSDLAQSLVRGELFKDCLLVATSAISAANNPTAVSALERLWIANRSTIVFSQFALACKGIFGVGRKWSLDVLEHNDQHLASELGSFSSPEHVETWSAANLNFSVREFDAITAHDMIFDTETILGADTLLQRSGQIVKHDDYPLNVLERIISGTLSSEIVLNNLLATKASKEL